jgi:intermembrane space import and assembly protein 40
MLARTAARRALSSRLAAPSRRPLSTAATPKKRSWKGAAFRWGLAGAGLYYYNTNDFFGEQEQGMFVSAFFELDVAELGMQD